MHEARIRIPARPPFDWRHSLEFIGKFPATREEQVVDGIHLLKAWRLAGHTLATRISPDGERGLLVEVACAQPVDAVLRESLTDRLTFYLSLDDDLAPLVAAADPHFALVEKQLHGYPQVKFPRPVEHVV